MIFLYYQEAGSSLIYRLLDEHPRVFIRFILYKCLQRGPLVVCDMALQRAHKVRRSQPFDLPAATPRADPSNTSSSPPHPPLQAHHQLVQPAKRRPTPSTMSLRLPSNSNPGDSPHDSLGHAGPATHRALDQEPAADPERDIRLVRVRVEVLLGVGHAAPA